MEMHVRLGATNEGIIKAIDLYTLSNTGAYGEHGPTTVGLSGHKAIPLYNKYQEAERLEIKERVFKEDNYVIKPLATIPELNLEIYSRCIVCRMIADGEFASLEDGDYEIWGRYLAN